MDWFPLISHRSRPRKSSTARCFRPSALDPLKNIATVESGFLPSESLKKKPEGPEVQDDCPPDSGSILFRNPPFSTNCQKPGRFSSNRLPRRRACVQTTRRSHKPTPGSAVL